MPKGTHYYITYFTSNNIDSRVTLFRNMVIINCLILLYVCLNGIDAIPTGLASLVVENYDNVLAVPANPRFPGLRPKPEATTFSPIQDNQLSDNHTDGSGEEEGYEDTLNDSNILPRNGPCRTEFETIYEIEEVETREEKCVTINE